MKFGFFCLMAQRDPSVSPAQVFANTVEQVKLAEDIGIDVAWFAEHHFSNYCLCVSPLMMAAYCAPLTERIRLGPAVVVLPLYDPMRLIEEIATVDVLSGGRLVLGIGSGYQPYEFERFRTTLDESLDRSVEILEMMDLAYAEETFSYEGEYYRQPPTALSIKPIQRPSPDIYIAGMLRDERMRRRLVEKRYVPLAQTWGEPSLLVDSRRNFEQMYEEYGRDPSELRMGVLRWFNVSDDPDEIRAAAEHLLYTFRVARATRFGYQQLDGPIHREIPADGEPSIEQIIEYQWLGDVNKVTAQMVDEIRAYRPGHITFSMGLGSHARTMAGLERLGAEVIPALEEQLGPLDEVLGPERSAAERVGR